MAPLLAVASGIWALVIADHLLKALLDKTTQAGIDDAAKWIAGLRQDRRKKKRLIELMDEAWREWSGQHASAAEAVRAVFLEPGRAGRVCPRGAQGDPRLPAA